MTTTRRAFAAAALAAATFCLPASSQAQGVDWNRYRGQTINLLFNNHPWSQAMRDLAREFTDRTGVTVRIEIFNEEQFRARLTTVMQARSRDIDGYMTLTIREGAVFDRAGWYADLTPFMRNAQLTEANFNYDDFGAALRQANTIGGKIVSLPINLEGPLFYWRRDLFQRCNIPEPMVLEDIPAAAQRLRACDANQGVWAARGLRGAVPYGMAGFVYNLGGEFVTPAGEPGLCQPATRRGIEMYANLLKDYGPPGATNHTFTQVIELLGQGRIAMTNESSNEFANIMRFPGRANDLGVKVLPPGRDTRISRPVSIGWGVAMSPHSERKEATWLFLQWATSPAVQTRLVQAGVAPPRASVFNGDEFRRWTAEQPIRQAWANALVQLGREGTGVYQTRTDRIPESRELIGRMVQELVLGQKTYEQACADADRDLARLQ